jgi:hypothetical protein
MHGKQQRIVAEDGGTHKCAAEQQWIIAEDGGTCKCVAKQSQRIEARTNAWPNSDRVS